jgi:hypothetical protein
MVEKLNPSTFFPVTASDELAHCHQSKDQLQTRSEH